MSTWIVRVWLPDRPGALGQVASRIGAVRGDVVGIDILERGAGRAIDELVVELPDASLVSLLLAEIDQVDDQLVDGPAGAPLENVDADHVAPDGADAAGHLAEGPRAVRHPDADDKGLHRVQATRQT